MATRQYVGARYVPKFYTNAVDGSSLWQDNVIYEPLTWVTRPNYRMYISRKTVPATVGAPEDNIEYWLQVGEFNGYISDLQSQINSATGNIATNTANIATNTTNIATNTANIATNTANISDINGEITNLSKFDLSFFKDKKIYILGDSLSATTVNAPNWVANFENTLDGICDSITNNSSGGYTIGNGATTLAALSNLDADILIVFLGTNDFGHDVTIGSSYSDSGTTTTCGSLNALASAIESAFTTTPQVFFITPPKRSDMLINTLGLVPECYNQCIQQYCIAHNWVIINPTVAPNMLAANATTDGLHISSAYAPTFSNFVIREMLAGGTGVVDIKSQGGNLTSKIAAGSGSMGYTVQGNILEISGRISNITLTNSGLAISSGLPSALLNVGADIAYEWPATFFISGAGIMSATVLFINNEIYAFPNYDSNGVSVTGDLHFVIRTHPSYCNNITFAS